MKKTQKNKIKKKRSYIKFVKLLKNKISLYCYFLKIVSLYNTENFISAEFVYKIS